MISTDRDIHHGKGLYSSHAVSYSHSEGNGTQRAFEDDPSILYISIHRYDDGEFYPTGTYGHTSSCGEGKGTGFSVNIPWPGPGMDDGDYIYAFQKIVMPIARQFNPDLVISRSALIERITLRV